MKDYVLILLAFGMFVCVVSLIAKAVSTADPESATKASSMLHPHRMVADAPDEMRNEKPTIENRVDR